jgi:cysteine desulfurase
MRIYLDHNATTPLRPEADASYRNATRAAAGNPSSLHAEGRAARSILESAREQVARLAGAPPRDVIFTSGGSEGIAAAMRGVAERASARRRKIVVSAIEHSAVLDTARALGRFGFETVVVACGPCGRVEAGRFVEALDDDVALAALQAANNETGVIQPVAEVGDACAAAGIPFLVDAVQAAGKIPIERDGWRADLLAISGHKLGAPAGTGALLVRDGLSMAPLIPGGAQERRRRGGTEAVAALAAFGAACDAARAAIAVETPRLEALRARLEAGLRALAPELRLHGEGVARLANTVNVAFPGVLGETLVIALDLAGVAASTGSACASGAVEPSHVIRAMGFDEAAARGAVRFSLGWSTCAADVESLLRVLPELLSRATMAGR